MSSCPPMPRPWSCSQSSSQNGSSVRRARLDVSSGKRSHDMSESAVQSTRQNPLQYVSEQLKDLRGKGVAPKLRILQGEQKPVCVFDGKEVINLASNNYLGLTTHKDLRKAALQATKTLGAGAGAVRTIAGTM